MSTTTKVNVNYLPRNIPVEIENQFEMGGVKLATVKALHGKPFADGAKTTTRTAYRTVRLEELDVCTCTPRDDIACGACKRLSQRIHGDRIPY